MTAPKKSASSAKSAVETKLALGLPGMLAHKKFPGRTFLDIPEVARVLEIDDKHLISLIQEGLMGAIEITGRGNVSSRKRWRIPVVAYDNYIRGRSNMMTDGKRGEEDETGFDAEDLVPRSQNSFRLDQVGQMFRASVAHFYSLIEEKELIVPPENISSAVSRPCILVPRESLVDFVRRRSSPEWHAEMRRRKAAQRKNKKGAR